ncbi:AEC family transporter [Pseudooceanicola sp. C21-150M6]|uniref:AEC family transporter n=1 Tax=Pseudooceanicola sp. C21-150M6 TaxID=3434355 RepID=UPI003D7F6C54
MLAVLSVTTPLFAIVLVGYLAARYGPFPRSAMRALGDFTMYIALPAALFLAVASRDLAEVIDPSYLVTLAIGSLATQLSIWIILRIKGTGPRRRALAVMGSATSNSAFLGFPIIYSVLPDHAGVVFAMNLLIENFLLTPIGLVLLASAQAEGPDRPKPLRLIGQIALSVLRRPLIIALLAAMAFIVMGLHLPVIAQNFFGTVGAAATPIALFVIGGTLYGLDLRGEIKLAGLIATVKLLLHPALVAIMMVLGAATFLPPLSPEMQAALILSATMPMFATYVMFAQEVGHEGLASLALTIAVCLSFVTINIALLVLI